MGVYRSGEEACAERPPWHKTDMEFFTYRQDRGFGLPRPDRILVLNCCHRVNGMGHSDGLRAGFGKSVMPDLSFVHQVFQCACNFFDWDTRIDAMLVIKINIICF